MKSQNFNIILGIFAFIVLIVPFTGKVHDGRFKWFKGFTFRGWFVILAFLISIGINYLKDAKAEQEENEKVQRAEAEKRQADSVSRKRNDATSAMIVHTFVHALAQHGLKYDSVERGIQRLIRDSSKKETKLIYGNHPELEIDNIQSDNRNPDTLHFKITFTSKFASSYHVSVKSYCIIETNQNKYWVNNFEDAYLNDVIVPQDKKLDFRRQLDGRNDKSDHAIFYFAFKGSYRDIGNKTFKFKTICSFDSENKVFGSTMEPTTTAIINILRSKGVNY